MNLINLLSTAFISLLLLSSCAHHKDVRPGADGIHKVQVQASSQQEGQRETLAQATQYCKSLNKRPAIIDENNVYQGDLDETVYQQSQKAKNAASILLGGTGYGHKANQAADTMLGKAYTINMSFKCQ